jgi:hypothetical protein
MEGSIAGYRIVQETRNRCPEIARRTKLWSRCVWPAHDRPGYHAATHEIAKPAARPLSHCGGMGARFPAGVPIARPGLEASADTTILIVLMHASNMDNGELATRRSALRAWLEPLYS